MGMMLLQLACVALVMLRHGTDADITGFTTPSAGGAVTTGVTTGETTTEATVVIVDGTVAGTTITTVTGSVDGSAAITYELTDTNIEIDSGAVKTKTGYTVDYATKPSFTLIITAFDADDNAVIATLNLTVTVNDRPTFTSPTLCWEIASDATVGTTVGTYTASAGTVGTDITTYSVATAGNTNVDFSATLTNGVLVTAKTPLGSENYTLVIQAVDDGAAPATGSISVTIRRMADGTTLQACPNGVSGLVGSLIVLITAMTAKFM